MFTILITGSRDWKDTEIIEREIDKIPIPLQSQVRLVQGGCRGADTIAKNYAIRKRWQVITVLPDWSLGRKAGPIRNQKMVYEYQPDYAIAFVKPNSKGTLQCLSILKKYKEIKKDLVIVVIHSASQ